MRLNAATFFVLSTLALAHAFNAAPANGEAKTYTSTSLDARRSMLPIIRRSRPSLLFPNFDRLFDEMDEMMESSLATIPRSPLSLFDENKDLKLLRPLGFEVIQGDDEYKISVHVPDVAAEDIDLQLDHDGRVLRLKGERNHEDGGMQVQSRFEKAILLSPDMDTTKLAANMSGATLTIVAPKIEKKDALEKFETKKITINFEEPELQVGEEVSTDKPPYIAARLDTDTMTNENMDSNKFANMDCEKEWPVKDFPH
jgi:HSP20 family molecular chaperone IbpA